MRHFFIPIDVIVKCKVMDFCLQFIIVSLKDGMFSNANVLFKTQFVNGLSTVSRVVNKNKS